MPKPKFWFSFFETESKLLQFCRAQLELLWPQICFCQNLESSLKLIWQLILEGRWGEGNSIYFSIGTFGFESFEVLKQNLPILEPSCSLNYFLLKLPSVLVIFRNSHALYWFYRHFWSEGKIKMAPGKARVGVPVRIRTGDAKLVW